MSNEPSGRCSEVENLVSGLWIVREDGALPAARGNTDGGQTLPQIECFKSRDIPDLLPADFQMLWNVVFHAFFSPSLLIQLESISLLKIALRLWDRGLGSRGRRKKKNVLMPNIKVRLFSEVPVFRVTPAPGSCCVMMMMMMGLGFVFIMCA